MLGERYGIPTEFTSYLVVEPRLRDHATTQWRGGGVDGDERAAPRRRTPTRDRSASSPPKRRRRSARRTQWRRSTRCRGGADDATSQCCERTCRVDASRERTYLRAAGRRVDRRALHAPACTTMKIKPFSKAYFDLLAQLPELRAALALGDRVIVVGRDRAISFARRRRGGAVRRGARARCVKAW